MIKVADRVLEHAVAHLAVVTTNCPSLALRGRSRRSCNKKCFPELGIEVHFKISLFQQSALGPFHRPCARFASQ